VKESYPLFDTKAFLSLCHKDELALSKNIKHTNFATTNLTFGRNRRYFSISTHHNQNKFHNNSINEAGRACAPPPKAPSNPTKSVGNKIYLFLMRTIIIMVGIILAKSLFLC
jgi:hypothetical protein